MKTQLELTRDRVKYEIEKEYVKIEASKNVVIGLQNALNIIEKGLTEESKSVEGRRFEGRHFVNTPTGGMTEVTESKILRDSKGFIIGGQGGAV